MEHVVFYPAATGVPAFRRVGSLDEAVNFVEHLRNDENVTDFSVHELAPVQLSFRAYYHAQLPATSPEESAAPDAPQLSVVPEPAVEVAPAEAPVAEVSPGEPAAEAPQAPVEQSAPVVEAVADVVEIADVVEATAEHSLPEEVPAVAEAAAEPTLAPIEATDDDRSAEWVAEAAIVEPPALEAPALEAATVPGLVADEPIAKPVLAAVEPIAEPVAEQAVASDEPVEAPVQRTPFADAPPVSAPAAEVEAPPADAEAGADAATGDVIPALAPSGRRSLGFFAR